MGRIVLAVVVGFLVWTMLWITAGRTVVSLLPDHFDAETHATESSPVLLLLIFVSVVVSLVAGWTAAHLARKRAARAARALAIVLLAPATIAGARLRSATGR